MHSISQNGQIDFHRISDSSWTEDTLTWNNLLPLGALIGSAQATSNTWTEIDVSSMVTSNGVYSAAIQTPVDSLGELSSKEGGMPPVLEIGTIALTPSQLYTDWVGTYPALSDTNTLSDPDGDLLANLAEYALGGNPTSNDAASILPFHTMGESLGTNWFNYIYTRHRDAALRKLTYEVQSTTNLVSNIWTNDTQEVGSAIIDANFEIVTNRVPTTGKAQQFLKLELGLED
ncbi:hypothetical protein SCARR_00710 [Pontiella sulfatireligans]|uniref:Carbohydrate-binding module family 96 domain-containing protein n=1 Tax=Pontiella sulfatireligans TaxID=2750658 RepID=A0A6C2UGL7_9BACT|nr:hypothetical protein SCARR_00710 [Pontiella sulfatireligans]